MSSNVEESKKSTDFTDKLARISHSRPFKAIVAILAIIGLIAIAVFVTTLGQTSAAAPPLEPAAGPDTSQRDRLEALSGSVVLIESTFSATVKPKTPDSGDGSMAGTPTMSKTFQPPRTVHVQGFCSGSFVSDDGMVLTNGHCFDKKEVIPSLLQVAEVGNLTYDDLSDPSKLPTTQLTEDDLTEPELTITLIQGRGTTNAVVLQPTPASLVVAQDTKQGDLALVKLDGVANTPAIKLACDYPTDANAIVRDYGFSGSLLASAVAPQLKVDLDKPYAPPNADDPSRTADDIFRSRIQPSYPSGTLNGKQYPNGVEYREISAPMTQGMSGGPTVTVQENGSYALLGTNSYLTDMQSFNFITSLENVVQFLKDHSVKFSQTCG